MNCVHHRRSCDSNLDARKTNVNAVIPFANAFHEDSFHVVQPIMRSIGHAASFVGLFHRAICSPSANNVVPSHHLSTSKMSSTNTLNIIGKLPTSFASAGFRRLIHHQSHYSRRHTIIINVTSISAPSPKIHFFGIEKRFTIVS